MLNKPYFNLFHKNSMKVENTTTIQRNHQEEREEESTIRDATQEETLNHNLKQPDTTSSSHLAGLAQKRLHLSLVEGARAIRVIKKVDIFNPTYIIFFHTFCL
jgi:cell division protein FtsL